MTYRVETNRRLIIVEAQSGMTAAVQAKPMLTRGERVQMVTLVPGQLTLTHAPTPAREALAPTTSTG